jgi:hypothetical protein
MVEFKYKYLKDGNPGFRTWKGQADATQLVLNNTPIPYTAFGQTLAREKRIFIQLLNNSYISSELQKQGIGQVLSLEILNYPADELKVGIDRIVSANFANAHKKLLESEGHENTFRVQICPNCSATIDLSDFDPSPHTYCPFCNVIFKSDTHYILEDSHTNDICPECNTYGEVKAYTDFFFYYLLIVAGYRYQVKYLCPTCADNMANAMFFKNALFVLGLVPTAFAKVRAMTSGDGQLNKARKFSLQGAYQKAAPIYETLYANYPEHPAILMTEAMGHLTGNDLYGGGRKIQQSIKSCANYYPAIRVMQSLQKTRY